MTIRYRITPTRTNSTTAVQVLDKRLVPGSNPGSCILARRLTGRTTGSEPENPGSNPGGPNPCMSFNSSGKSIVVLFTRMQIPSYTHLGVVQQQNARLGSERHQGRHLALRYARLAKTVMRQIANLPCDGANPSPRCGTTGSAWLGKLVNPTALEAVVSRFESETGHHA